MSEQNSENFNNDDAYQSVNAAQIKAAREANNVWEYDGKEYEKFVANGMAQVATEILNPATKQPTGAILIHEFVWEDTKSFIVHENSFSTSMRRVGRSSKQRIKSAQSVPANAKLYEFLVSGGKIRTFENGEAVDIRKSREDMLLFSNNYPESSSEAIEAWFGESHFELIDESDEKSFNWMFENTPTKRILWKLGEKESPVAIGILTFNSPIKETREKFDEESQIIDTDKQGDVSIAEVRESFIKKLEYGARHLANVEGIAVGSEGVDFTKENKNTFLNLFNPIWFADAVEVLHESFEFTRGKSN